VFNHPGIIFNHRAFQADLSGWTNGLLQPNFQKSQLILKPDTLECPVFYLRAPKAIEPNPQFDVAATLL
jgi:hypothetical protein